MGELRVRSRRSRGCRGFEMEMVMEKAQRGDGRRWERAGMGKEIGGIGEVGGTKGSDGGGWISEVVALVAGLRVRGRRGDGADG